MTNKSEPEREDLEPLFEEEQYIGMESHLVPKVPPGQGPNFKYETCNAKKTKTIEEDERGYVTYFEGYCNSRTGAGTEDDDGRCKWHGGASKNGGAPKHNQNAQKHAANVDPHHYTESLPQDEEEFVRDVAASIEDRIRGNRGSVDFLDRVLCRRVAVELHIVARESDYVENVSGMLQTIVTEHDSHEEQAPLLEDIRKRDKDILGMLKNLGVLDDPESQTGGDLADWKQFIEQGQKDDHVIIEEDPEKSGSE